MPKSPIAFAARPRPNSSSRLATAGELLRALNQDVELAHDGLSAVTSAAVMQPDIVLLDIGLPGIDGYEAARRIRAQSTNPRPVRIAATGWGQDSDKQLAYQAGVDYHVLKPVELDRIVEILRELEQ